MKVRDIDFHGLACSYSGWKIKIRILNETTNISLDYSTFEDAKTHLTVAGYLDRDCEVCCNKPIRPDLDKYIEFEIVVKPGETLDQTISKFYNNNNEERKMKVKDIDFKKLQKENEKYTFSVELFIYEGIHSSSKLFDSFTAVKNYLTSHPRWFDYAEFTTDIRVEEYWDNFIKGIKKNITFTIKPEKKDTPKVPYYQFHNGNCIIVNGKTYAPEIKDVIFNPPATIVKWADGTKTVVKSHGGDVYDPEVGLAMAISKKMYGNNYSYYNVFKKWLKKFDDSAAKKALAIRAKDISAEDLRKLEVVSPVGELNCKDCEHFKPDDNAKQLGYDGTCEKRNLCMDAFDTCAEGMKRAGEALAEMSDALKE